MPSSEGEDTTGGMSQAREVLPRPPTLKDWPRGSLTHPVKHVKIRAMAEIDRPSEWSSGDSVLLAPSTCYSLPGQYRNAGRYGACWLGAERCADPAAYVFAM